MAFENDNIDFGVTRMWSWQIDIWSSDIKKGNKVWDGNSVFGDGKMISGENGLLYGDVTTASGENLFRKTRWTCCKND